ncbi:unnamed protein product [Prorocentrum cordatum]|uniref:Folate gamma-glutamyl hydrolase n=1 Tax=Prorocentrum cordatum TaxID=2364126 RepID=A0ABN9Y1G0_9DINO|nr:unnamed protein product [Polarella glacialis]
MPAHVLGWVTTENVTSNLHHDGVLPATYATNERLSLLFRVLSTNRDRKGKPFVSTVEARQYPIYGVQWHPERPIFSWDADEGGINHGAHAIESMQYFANFLVNEARKNDHRFPSANDERGALIYNYVPIGHSSLSWYGFPPANGSAAAADASVGWRDAALLI